VPLTSLRLFLRVTSQEAIGRPVHPDVELAAEPPHDREPGPDAVGAVRVLGRLNGRPRPIRPGPAWAKGRTRRRRCGVPKAVRYRTRHEPAREVLKAAWPLLPLAQDTGDDEVGHPSRSRTEVRDGRALPGVTSRNGI